MTISGANRFTSLWVNASRASWVTGAATPANSTGAGNSTIRPITSTTEMMRLIGPELLSSGLEERHQDRDQQDGVAQGGVQWGVITASLGRAVA